MMTITPIISKKMTAREEIQHRLADWMQTWTTAPYGVLTSLYSREDGPGKARIITFGLARTLDATLFIWSAKRFELKSSRTHTIERFDSEADFVSYCVREFGASSPEND